MWRNQIPEFPDFGRHGIPASKPDYTNPLADLYPQPTEQPQGWDISMFLTIHPAATGRGANTGFWVGLSGLYFWIDREKRVGGTSRRRLCLSAVSDVSCGADLQATLIMCLSSGGSRIVVRHRICPLRQWSCVIMRIVVLVVELAFCLPCLGYFGISPAIDHNWARLKLML